ncbi:TniQ family protein [Streptomyces hygroscopicus]|uniref:TniQ family protein n=1 Tax=Streptomyces hygroscopicus TaxID=1912 RepID=UPI0036B70EBF
MTDTVRTLPIRLAPLPAEALDSWLEALATRMSTPFANVLTAVGLSASAYGLPRWAMMLGTGEAEQIAAATGTDAEQIISMTLQRWDGQALVIDPVRRIGRPQTLWSGPRGSRYCPACLVESGSRWPAAWRLTWSFACTRHHVLLADRCPECDRSPRSRCHQLAGVPRPGLCPAPVPRTASRDRWCHHSYAATTVLPIEPDGPLERAQQFMDALLHTSAPDTSMPLYGETAPSVFQLLSDVKALASMVLNYSIRRDFSPWCPPEVANRLDNYRATPVPRSQRRSQRADRHSTYAPTDAAAIAVGVTAAMRILQAGDVRGVGDAARWLTDRVAASGRAPYPASYTHWGGGLSPALTVALRCSREHHLLPLARLRHRTPTGVVKPPCDTTTRAKAMPVGLWPAWALRLTPYTPGGLPTKARAAELLSVACLMVGSRTSITAAIRALGGTVIAHAVSDLLATLTSRSDCTGVLRVLTLLADHLDDHGSPIDYARRRAVFGSRSTFIDARQWQTLQKRLRSNSACSPLHAQRWLFHTLTGTPPHLANPAIATATGPQRAQYQRFCWRILPAEHQLLQQTAQQLLVKEGIDEPLTWTPELPGNSFDGLALPGPDPDSLMPEQLHQLVPRGDFSIAQLAKRLGTTTAHARYLLAQHPVDWSPPRYCQTQATTERVIQWKTWYEEAGLSMDVIADRAQVSRAAVRIALSKHGVAIRRSGGRPAYDHRLPEILHRRQELRQSFSRISADISLSATTIRNMLDRHKTQPAEEADTAVRRAGRPGLLVLPGRVIR